MRGGMQEANRNRRRQHIVGDPQTGRRSDHRKTVDRRCGALSSLEYIGDQQRELQLRLSGPWVENNLQPLRDALTDLNYRPRSVILDLSHVCHLDSAVLGVLALLRGHQLKSQQSMAIAGTSPALRRQLDHFCAAYLLEPLVSVNAD